MNEYEIEVKLCFVGSVTVEAANKHDAVRIVRDNFRAMLGNCETNECPAIIDWDIEPHSTTTVKQ